MSTAVVRPDTFLDQRDFVLRCTDCRERLVYRVYGVGETIRWRLLWLATGLLGLAVGGVAIWIGVSGQMGADSLPASRLLVLLVATPITAFGFVRWSNESGVRGPGVPTWTIWNGPHEVSIGDVPTGSLLVCEHCDHSVPLGFGPQAYYEAKRRLAEHPCPGLGAEPGRKNR
ncbi:hypothetical protein [Parafrankia sp. FMc2]|uniref:hypothetical protein n=1 Tax=Parafrankia sp. FMc2 TaxID=3233196 RepID=UPI0034D47420